MSSWSVLSPSDQSLELLWFHSSKFVIVLKNDVNSSKTILSMFSWGGVSFFFLQVAMIPSIFLNLLWKSFPSICWHCKYSPLNCSFFIKEMTLSSSCVTSRCLYSTYCLHYTPSLPILYTLLHFSVILSPISCKSAITFKGNKNCTSKSLLISFIFKVSNMSMIKGPITHFSFQV